MSIYLIMLIICLIVGIIFFIISACNSFENVVIFYIWIGAAFIAVVLGITLISNYFNLKNEMIRQNKERAQIIYQIEHITDSSDKVKLNEWILTYNDWVNDINTNKEMYGIFSWYYTFDMTNHTIINLV